MATTTPSEHHGAGRRTNFSRKLWWNFRMESTTGGGGSPNFSPVNLPTKSEHITKLCCMMSRRLTQVELSCPVIQMKRRRSARTTVRGRGCRLRSRSALRVVIVHDTLKLKGKKGTPWTEDEHRLFLIGLDRYGKGDWRSISRNVVVTRTPTQVASHAQKYFLRHTSGKKERKRSSIHDITTANDSLPMPAPTNLSNQGGFQYFGYPMP